MAEVDKLLAMIEHSRVVMGHDKISGQLEHLETLEKLIEMIKSYTYSNKHMIPGYILKRAQETTGQLQLEVTRLRKELNPNRRFKFRLHESHDANKKSETTVPSDDTTVISTVNPSPQAVESTSAGNENFVGFRDISNSSSPLVLEPSDTESKDVKLINIDHSELQLTGLLNTVYIKNLEQCCVRVGLANRSIMVTNCKDCTFHLACQQLRINSSRDCTFRLYISSRAMLENSTRLRFEPLTWTFENSDALFERANFDPAHNNWNQVDDFDWLSPEQSKNVEFIQD